MATSNAHFIFVGTKLYFVVLLLLSMIRDSFAHPQCLDFFPPFSFDQGDQPEFCTLYQDFGCCTLAKDRQIRQTFQTIVTEYNTMHGSLSSNCSNFLREILCQECSPYAAHVFDGEDSPENIRQLPGLCSDYCTKFHRYCGQLVPFITTEELVRQAAADSAVEFCDRMAITDMDYCFPDVLTDDDLSKWVGEAQSGTGRSQCLCLEEFAGGLRNPMFAIHANDNTHRLFIGEQLGVIHVFLENRTRLETPFLDIRDSVTVNKFNGDERGLLGAAFHPNFTDNSIFYVFYTAGPRLNNIFIRISEFKVMASDKNRADVSTERVILDEDQPYANHNGGQLLFGLDGYLYASLGDGGAGGDPHNVALNKNSLLGKILRIDVDSPTGGRNYGIPPDNPFVGVVNTRPEIYAYGVRNSWRGSVDRGDRLSGYGKGRMFFGDVGQSSYEEVNIIVKGGNYGWRAKEGFSCFNSGQCNDQWLADEILPIHSYPHSEGKCVIGGFVYRGCQSPNLNGKYIFGDFQYGRLFQLIENTTTNTWERQDICLGDSSVCKGNLVSTFPRYIMSFAEDERGEVYFMGKTEESANNDRGQILKIVDPGRRGNPSECSTEVSTVVDNPTTQAEPTTTADLTSTVDPSINQLTTSDSPITAGRPITTESPINGRLATTDSESTTTADLTSTMEPTINQLPTSDSPITAGRPITTESPINGRLATTNSADLTSTMEPTINQLLTSDSPITTGRPITTESPINGRLATTDSAELTSTEEPTINPLPTSDSPITTSRPITTESPINGRLATTDSESLSTTDDQTSTDSSNKGGPSSSSPVLSTETNAAESTIIQLITTESSTTGRSSTSELANDRLATTGSTLQLNTEESLSSSPLVTTETKAAELTINQLLSTQSSTTGRLSTSEFADRLATTDSILQLTTEGSLSSSSLLSTETKAAESTINALLTSVSSTTGRSSTSEFTIDRLATTDSTLQLTTEVTVGLRILALNGISARFTDDLADSSSQAFRELSAQVTMAVLDILRGSPSTALVVDFVISSIRSGSLLVNGIAIFPTNSAIEANALVQVLNSAGSNDGDASSSLTIDPSATYAAVPNQGCPTNYCTNGGICKQVGSPQDHVYSCECVEGYTGRLCENGGPEEGDNFPLVVILAAVGVLALAIVVGLMAAVIMTRARSARRVERPETNAPRYHHQRSFGVGFVDRAKTRPPSQYWVRNLERENFRLPYVVPDTPVEEFWGDAFYY